MRHSPIIATAILSVLAVSAASAQSRLPAQQAPAEVLTETLTPPGGQAAPTGEDWNPVSRSRTLVYLVDVNHIAVNGDVSAVTMARVPISGEAATGYNYASTQMEFRCAAKQSRSVAEIDHDEAGAPGERYESGEEFTAYDANSLDGYIAVVVCGGERAAPPTFPSIKAFIDGGRR